MSLDTGDTVYLRKHRNPKDTFGEGKIEDIMFCVELVKVYV